MHKIILLYHAYALSGGKQATKKPHPGPDNLKRLSLFSFYRNGKEKAREKGPLRGSGSVGSEGSKGSEGGGIALSGDEYYYVVSCPAWSRCLPLQQETIRYGRFLDSPRNDGSGMGPLRVASAGNFLRKKSRRP
ncbi:hypothetical protein [Dialister succinatiphilus]|uniref:hypothetical protein n=1 Tax=Dialister succinatiphilus TaxID=487173 RepID=UPI002355AF90|nr:hypothetical protein [Dialister succinatiphilus]MCI6029986.1 hypothetical protein [Dialister succinatiphilus]